MDKALVTTLGIALIGFIYWFFFGKKEEAGEVRTSWDILVNGGYQPAVIRIPRGKTSTLIFTRTDTNSCLEEIIVPQLKIKKFLPLHKGVSLLLSPEKPGTYAMHCGMHMFHGKIIVV